MSVIVNTDYESILFDNRPSLKMVRELEFLGLWLNERVRNSSDYKPEYLNYIKKHSGTLPQLVKSDPRAVNWWGELKNLPKERYLNSKETSFHISQQIGENYGIILSNSSQKSKLAATKEYLFKSFAGVSGKGHKFIGQLNDSDFPLLAEEFHQREMDFSTYVLSNGDFLFYQNFIGNKFGYKGSLFDLENAGSLFDLDFVKVRPLNWGEYLEKIKKITEVVRSFGNHGFSIDSYVFDHQIRALCEINYRRTMGLTAYEIAKKISNKRFQLFLILKPVLGFQEVLNICTDNQAVLLSHEQTMFSYILISADTKDELKKKNEEVSLALGMTLTVEIE